VKEVRGLVEKPQMKYGEEYGSPRVAEIGQRNCTYSARSYIVSSRLASHRIGFLYVMGSMYPLRFAVNRRGQLSDSPSLLLLSHCSPVSSKSSTRVIRLRECGCG
jgi:hypothetical protein